MKNSKYLTFISCFVLFLLLNSIDVSFSVPAFQRGFLHQLQVFPDYKPQFSIFTEADLVESKKITNDTNSIIFVGDVLLARNVEVLSSRNGYDYPYRGVDFNILSVNPYVVGNFESSVPKIHRPTEALLINFSTSVKFLPALKQAGFTHLSLANNHSFDYGQLDFLNTITELQNSKLKTFGHPTQLDSTLVEYMTIQDRKVALIGMHTLFSVPSKQEIKTFFTEINKKSDLQIVYIHWGDEYKTKNNQAQKRLAQLLVKAGADLIVGHHPHVVQNIDYIDDVPVFYSLGNYIFDQYFSTETQVGLMLQLQFLSDNEVVQLIPVTSVSNLSQPHFMNEEAHALFLNDLSEISSPEIVDYIRQGLIPLNTRVATSSKIAMIDVLIK